VSAVDADVLVAGGGPVGLAAATLARLAGLSVVLADPREGAIDKACGEGLMPSALAALHRLDVDPAGFDFAGIAYVQGRWRAEARFTAATGRGVRRTAVSAALAARADDVGVQRWTGRVTRVLENADQVSAELTGTGSPPAVVTARWLLAADGLHSPLRRNLGLERPPHGPARYGLRRHFAMAPWSDLVEVHWADAVEAYVTPVSPTEVGVALLGARGASFDGWLAQLPALRDRLAGAEPSTAVRGAGPLRQTARSVRQGRVLLVGDAAGYVDALTGEGIAVGLRSAEAAVRCVVAGRPGRYPHEWRVATRRCRAMTTTVLWASQRPNLRRLLVPGAAVVPSAFRAAVDVLA